MLTPPPLGQVDGEVDGDAEDACEQEIGQREGHGWVAFPIHEGVPYSSCGGACVATSWIRSLNPRPRQPGQSACACSGTFEPVRTLPAPPHSSHSRYFRCAMNSGGPCASGGTSPVPEQVAHSTSGTSSPMILRMAR